MDTVVYVDEQKMSKLDSADAMLIWTYVVRRLHKGRFRGLGIMRKLRKCTVGHCAQRRLRSNEESLDIKRTHSEDSDHTSPNVHFLMLQIIIPMTSQRE